jgi:hypothetical protein
LSTAGPGADPRRVAEVTGAALTVNSVPTIGPTDSPVREIRSPATRMSRNQCRAVLCRAPETSRTPPATSAAATVCSADDSSAEVVASANRWRNVVGSMVSTP